MEYAIARPGTSRSEIQLGGGELSSYFWPEPRNFEKSCIEGSKTGEIHGELHTGIGQEAIGAVIKHFCRKEDALVSTHRNHVHAIGKNVSMRELMAEIFEKETGICKGRGGHMHPFDQSNNFSATGIVGSSIPVALGYAYGFWYENNDNI